MRFPRSSGRALLQTGLAFAVAFAAASLHSSPARSSAPTLDAYRAFIRTPEAGRLFRIARTAMRSHWGNAPAWAVRDTAEVRWPAAPAGVYLSLVDEKGTRACVGSVSPYRGGLAETVRELAREALQTDRRRPPIRREELSRLRVVIAFAGETESVEDPMEVSPGREGLLIASGESSIAFLPGEARTVDWALREARRVGVLQGPRDQARYFRFPVVVFAEPRLPRSHEEDPDESP